MRPPRLLAADEAAQIIEWSVQDNALAVICTQTNSNWCTFKSRFLEHDPRRRFFVLDYQETHGATPPELIQGQYVGISVRHRSHKLMFASLVEARGRFLLEDGTSINAVRYRWPESVTELQRRAYNRTPIPRGTTLNVQLWSGAASLTSARPESVVAGTALDISCGGCLLRADTGALPDWCEDQTLCVELGLPDGRPPLLLHGAYRGVRREEGRPLIAIQFVGLEISADGRTALQRLARCIQRLHRAGAAANYPSDDARHPSSP